MKYFNDLDTFEFHQLDLVLLNYYSLLIVFKVQKPYSAKKMRRKRKKFFEDNAKILISVFFLMKFFLSNVFFYYPIFIYNI